MEAAFYYNVRIVDSGIMGNSIFARYGSALRTWMQKEE